MPTVNCQEVLLKYQHVCIQEEITAPGYPSIFKIVRSVSQHLSAVFKFLDICHKGHHPLSCSSDEKLVPDSHFWLDAKPCADPD